MSEEPTSEETYVPLKTKKSIKNKLKTQLIFLLIILGAALFFSVLFVFRSGGFMKFLFVGLAIILSYVIIETIKNYKKS